MREYAYTDIVMDHFRNPRNVGEMKDPSGEARISSPICGDIMELFLKIDDKGVIIDVKFRTFGCGAAIASSSILTEMVKGKTVEEALRLTNEEVVRSLGGLPEAKIHCSVLAEDALKKAIENYYNKKNMHD